MSLSIFGHGFSLAPLVDHLWQSTATVLIACLLARVLRRQSASLRYGIWLAASLKFLLPLAFLVQVGQALRPAKTLSTAPPSAFTKSVEYIARPFSQLPPNIVHYSPVTAHFREGLLYAMLVVWLAGTVAVLVHWERKRRRIRRALQASAPSAIQADIPVVYTASTLEPGVFGLFKPILLLPTGITERLSAPQLRAVVAHEMCHVRRRDNFTAALHMLVQALFWFHPFVWWIGARLIDERERACDEHVLALGSDPQVYAESILKVCNFYLESPLFCAAGVTGSHLKKRIEAIMNNYTPQNLRVWQKLLIAAITVAGLLLPVEFGVLRAAQNSAGAPQIVTASFYNAPPLRVYEAVSVRRSKDDPAATRSAEFRPDGFSASNVTLQMLIQQACGVEGYQIAGAPAWVNRDGYDVEARVSDSVAEELRKGDANQFSAEQQPMLLELLADRFHLSVHRETRQLPGYALVISENGSKLHQATPGDTYPNGIKDTNGNGHGGVISFHRAQLTGQGISLGLLARELSHELGRPVLDRTGLTGNYDFSLQWSDGRVIASEYIVESREPGTALRAPRLDPPVQSSEFSGPSIFAALHDQLGLELRESSEQSAPAEILVIDHAEPVSRSESNATPNNTHDTSAGFESVMITPNKTGEPMAGLNVKGRPMQAVVFKGDRFMATNFPLRGLIRVAYKIPESQILEGPEWIDSEKYDVEAKLDPAEMQKLATLSPDERNFESSHLVQSLLADRFKLLFHRDTRQLLGYALVVAADGPKVQKAKPGDTYPTGITGPGGHPIGAGTLVQPEKSKLVGQGVPLSDLAKQLSQYQLHRPVVDLSGLSGNFDFTLQWTASPDKSGELETSSILAAVQQQLGLKLQLQNLPTEVLVIDRAEQPSPQ